MKPITRELAEQLLPDLREAVVAQIESWDAQRRIELAVGADFSHFGEEISWLSGGADDDGGNITTDMVMDLLASLKVDEEHHPNTDDHRAACVVCITEHDKETPDA